MIEFCFVTMLAISLFPRGNASAEALGQLTQAAGDSTPVPEVRPRRSNGSARAGISSMRGEPLSPALADSAMPEPAVTPGEWYFAWANCAGGAASYDVCFSTAIIETPGHAHSDGRPEMKVYDPFCRTGLRSNQPATWRWRAPTFASRLAFNISISGACTAQFPSRAAARIPDLKELQPGPGYRLEAPSPPHPYGHFGTTTTLAALASIASDYKTEFPQDPDLLVEDISLPWGGLFDRDGSWAPPHSGHRFGREADVRFDAVPAEHRNRLEEIFRAHGATVSLEGRSYHLDFTPKL